MLQRITITICRLARSIRRRAVQLLTAFGGLG
jgi:hypothetical protein